MNPSCPEGPDPKEEGAIFLGWLKKRGVIRKFQDCERKCKKNGFQAKIFVKKMGDSLIGLYTDKEGKKVIFLKNKVWADQWMIFYDKEVPHHRQTIKLKK